MPQSAAPCVSNQALTDLLNPETLIQSLLNKPDQYWVDLANEYLGPDASMLRMFGHPNKSLHQEVNDEKEARVNQRMAQIGPQGLKRMQEWIIACRTWLDVRLKKKGFLNHILINNQALMTEKLSIDDLCLWQEKPAPDLRAAIKMPSVGGMFLNTYSEYKNFGWKGTQMVRMKPELVPAVPNLDLRQLMEMNIVVQDIPLLTSSYVSSQECSTVSGPSHAYSSLILVLTKNVFFYNYLYIKLYISNSAILSHTIKILAGVLTIRRSSEA